MRLYSITTVVEGWPSRESEQYGGARTIAICSTLKRAKQIIERNEGDIFEYSYRYAVIATVQADALYGFLGLRQYRHWWYQWVGDSSTGSYQRCECPQEYKHILWGIS